MFSNSCEHHWGLEAVFQWPWWPHTPRTPPCGQRPQAPSGVPPARKGGNVVGLWGGLPSRTVLNPCPTQIVFDECHKAKNASSTKMGKAVLDLQNKLPLARVVYASATGEGPLIDG